MIYGMYCMEDIKTGFCTPTVDVNDAAAVRNFASAVMQSQGVLFTHAEDFRLWHIADFDSESGVVTPLSPIVHLSDGSAVLKGGKSSV